MSVYETGGFFTSLGKSLANVVSLGLLYPSQPGIPGLGAGIESEASTYMLQATANAFSAGKAYEDLEGIPFFGAGWESWYAAESVITECKLLADLTALESCPNPVKRDDGQDCCPTGLKIVTEGMTSLTGEKETVTFLDIPAGNVLTEEMMERYVNAGLNLTIMHEGKPYKCVMMPYVKKGKWGQIEIAQKKVCFSQYITSPAVGLSISKNLRGIELLTSPGFGLNPSSQPGGYVPIPGKPKYVSDLPNLAEGATVIVEAGQMSPVKIAAVAGGGALLAFLIIKGALK